MTDLPDIPPGLTEFLDRHTSALVEAIGTKLVASFVHGSVAMGSFVPFRSDLDLMVVVSDPLDLDAKSRLVRHLWELSTPEAIRGVETRVVTRHEIATSERMEQTELLISTHPGEPVTVDNTTDAHLFIELNTAAQISLSIHGPPARELIGSVEPISVLRWMLHWRTQDLTGEGQGEPESFAVLSAARSLVYLEHGSHVGKVPAAMWAIDHGYPEALLLRAIAVQRGDSRDRALTPTGREFIWTVIERLNEAIQVSNS